MYEYTNGLEPPGLTQLALSYLSKYYHNYPTLPSTHLSLSSDTCHKQRAAYSIKHFGAKFGNVISLEIKDSVSVSSFQYSYKKYILLTNPHEWFSAGFSLFCCTVYSAFGIILWMHYLLLLL